VEHLTPVERDEIDLNPGNKTEFRSDGVVPARQNSIQLRVSEAYHKDAGKGVARIGAKAMPVF